MKTVKNRAFTLIELLVSITIIALLTSVATASFLTAQKHSRDSARKASVNNISSAVEAYYMVNKKFPGMINLADLNLTPVAQNTYLSTTRTAYIDCQTLIGTTTALNYFLYYYKPKSDCSNYDTLASQRVNTPYYSQADYAPDPNWIPGLGPFINPIPIETKFQGNALNTAILDPIVNANTTTSTILYRKLSGGYMIYSKLESSDDADLDKNIDFKSNPSIFIGGAYLPVITVLGTGMYSNPNNLYIVRK